MILHQHAVSVTCTPRSQFYHVTKFWHQQHQRNIIKSVIPCTSFDNKILVALCTRSCLLPPQSRAQGLSETARGQVIFRSRSISVRRINSISWRTFIRAYTRFTHLCYCGCMPVTCIATRSDNCCYIFCYFAMYIRFCIIPFMQYACYSAWRRRRRQLRSIGLGDVSCCS